MENMDGENMNQLDVSDFKQTGEALVKAIADHVQATQLVLIRELPNELVITQAQFDNLMTLKNGTSYMSAVDIPSHIKSLGRVKKAYMYFTPFNAMDVKIKDQN